MSKLVSSSGHCERCDHNGCFTVYEEDGVISTHCFSCKYTTGSRKKKKKERSLFPNNIKVFPDKVELPLTRCNQFPQHILKYMLENGLNNTLIERYALSYVEHEYVCRPGSNHLILLEDALILPIYTLTGNFFTPQLSRYQVRSFIPGAQKYINIGSSGSLFRIGGDYNSHTVIIVEDILSAIRLYSATGYGVVACTGTSLSESGELQVVNSHDKTKDKFIVWLDGDQPGQTAARKMVKRLKLLGVQNVINIKTEKDPKKLWEQEIKDALKDII